MKTMLKASQEQGAGKKTTFCHMLRQEHTYMWMREACPASSLVTAYYIRGVKDPEC